MSDFAGRTAALSVPMPAQRFVGREGSSNELLRVRGLIIALGGDRSSSPDDRGLPTHQKGSHLTTMPRHPTRRMNDQSRRVAIVGSGAFYVGPAPAGCWPNEATTS